MTRKNRTPEENARREKIRELLQMANIGSMDDIQNLFKETIAEFMENGLEAELDDELGYSRYDYRNKATDNSRNGHSSKTLRTSFGDVEVSMAQSQILCKLPTRREQIRIQCARQRIYPTAACVQYNAGGDGCQGRRQGRCSSERRAAARRPLTSGPGGVIRACVRQNRWTTARGSRSSPAAVPSTFS